MWVVTKSRHIVGQAALMLARDPLRFASGGGADTDIELLRAVLTMSSGWICPWLNALLIKLNAEAVEDLRLLLLASPGCSELAEDTPRFLP